MAADDGRQVAGTALSGLDTGDEVAGFGLFWVAVGREVDPRAAEQLARVGKGAEFRIERSDAQTPLLDAPVAAFDLSEELLAGLAQQLDGLPVEALLIAFESEEVLPAVVDG